MPKHGTKGGKGTKKGNPKPNKPKVKKPTKSY